MLQHCLTLNTAKEVRDFLITEMTQRFPEMKMVEHSEDEN